MQTHCQKPIDQAIKTLKWRYGSISVFVTALWFMIAWNFAAGLIILILRQTGGAFFDFIGFSLAGVPVSLLAAALIVHRRLHEQQGWLALVDSYNKSGGLLLAACETDDFSWSGRFPEKIVVPQLRLDSKGLFLSFLASIAFLLLCLNLPVMREQIGAEGHLDLKELEKTAEEQIGILAEEGMLSTEEAKNLLQSLKQIADDSDRNDPASTFEALDQLKDRLKKQAAAGSRAMAGNIENLGKLHSLADQLGRVDAQSQETSALSQAIASSLGSAKDGGSIDKTLDKLNRALEKTAKGEPGASAAAEQARKELQEYIRQQAEKAAAAAAAVAERLARARLIDQKTFEELKKAGKIRPAEASDLESGSGEDLLLVPSDGDCSSSGSGESGKVGGAGETGAGQKQGGGQGKPDQSGTSGASGQAGPGGGHAPLNFNRRTSEHNVNFKDQNLPAPSATALEQSVAIGMSISAPVENDSGSSSGGSESSWQKPADSSVESGIILPKHRSAVKKYFDHQTP